MLDGDDIERDLEGFPGDGDGVKRPDLTDQNMHPPGFLPHLEGNVVVAELVFLLDS